MLPEGYKYNFTAILGALLLGQGTAKNPVFMRLRKSAPALLLALLVPALTFSQPHPTDKVTQGIEWFSLANNIKLHKRVSLLVEGQFRFAGQFEPMQFQFRTAPEIHVKKNLSEIPFGYVYTWNPLYGKQPAKYVNNEHRIYQQV